MDFFLFVVLPESSFFISSVLFFFKVLPVYSVFLNILINFFKVNVQAVFGDAILFIMKYPPSSNFGPTQFPRSD